MISFEDSSPVIMAKVSLCLLSKLEKFLPLISSKSWKRDSGILINILQWFWSTWWGMGSWGREAYLWCHIQWGLYNDVVVEAKLRHILQFLQWLKQEFQARIKRLKIWASSNEIQILSTSFCQLDDQFDDLASPSLEINVAEISLQRSN